MNRSELASVLGVSESYLQSHWKKAIESRKKQGIEVIKVGRGDSAQYGVKFPWDLDICWDTDELRMI